MNEPLIVKLSGGRSSGRMLKLLLDNGTFVRERDFAIFTNTGKEHPATLDFLHEMETRWEVPLVWLEFDKETKYRQVNYITASRDGRPLWDALVGSHCGVVPTVLRRVCTSRAKIEVLDDFLKKQGFEDTVSALGYRADERHRKAKMVARGSNAIFPLIDAGIDTADVLDWWKKNDFDLQLPSEGGRTILGNCDLCFMKGANDVIRILDEHPEMADWWIKLEEELERKRNSQGCQYWRLREKEGSSWDKVSPPASPDKNHRQASDGQWWKHNGEHHKVTIFFKHSYKELLAAANSGVAKNLKPRKSALKEDEQKLFAAMPCDCGD